MRKIATAFRVFAWTLLVLSVLHLSLYLCKGDVDRVMPRWPLMYMRIDEPGAMLNAFFRVPVVEEGVLDATHGDTRLAAATKWVARQVIGRRIAAAVYHSVKADERLHAVVVCDLGYFADLAARFYFAMLSFVDDDTVEHWKGVHILRVRTSSGDWYMTQRGGKLFTSDDPYWIKRMVDPRGRSSLHESEYHKAFMRARPRRTSFAGYIDTTRSSQFMIVNEGRFAPQVAFFEPMVKSGLTFDGISRISLFGFSQSRLSLDVRLSVEYDHEELSYVVSRYFERESKENTTYADVPATADAYAWVGNVSPALFWVMWANAVGEQQYGALRQDFFTRTGLDIEKDVVESLGYEYGAYADISAALPKAALFLAVKDGVALNKALELLRVDAMHTQTYRGRSISVYDTLGATFGSKPAYMVDNGRLWFASDVSVLTDAIDAKDGERADFTKNKVFAADRLRATDRSSMMIYLGVADIAEKASELYRRYASDPRAALMLGMMSAVDDPSWEQFKQEYMRPFVSFVKQVESVVFRLQATDGCFTADAHMYFLPKQKTKKTDDARA